MHNSQFTIYQIHPKQKYKKNNQPKGEEKKHENSAKTEKAEKQIRNRHDRQEGMRLAAGFVRCGHEPDLLDKSDAHRAGDVIARIRGLTQGAAPERRAFDLNQAVEEMLALSRSELDQHGVAVALLLDADLPAPGPAEAMRRLSQVAPHAAVVVLAGADDTEALERALALGARGWLTPEVNRAELAAVAAHVHAVSSMTPTPTVPARNVEHRPQSATPDAERTQPVLTRRELEVLVGMSNGRSNSQIGQDLYLSEDTVKTHARRLFRKLGASDRAQAVAIGMRRGLIQ